MTIIQSTLAIPPRKHSKRRNRVTDCLSQSPDLMPSEIVWGRIGKWAVQAEEPTKILELSEFCIEKWSKML